MRQKILFLIALLCAVAQGAWADEVTTQCTNVFTGFTATAGAGGTGDGGYAKLVDGNTNTKWCTNSSPFYIEFHSSAPFVPTGYIMTTSFTTISLTAPCSAPAGRTPAKVRRNTASGGR